MCGRSWTHFRALEQGTTMSRIPVKEYVKQIMQASKRDDAEAVELLLEEFGRKRSEESNTALREQIKAAI